MEIEFKDAEAVSDGEFTKCYKCFRPIKSCYCKYIRSFDPGVKFIILMHPKEAYKQKTGTGRLAHLTLENSEILIGINFTQNARLKELLADERYFPVLLYPGEDAYTAETLARSQGASCEVQSCEVQSCAGGSSSEVEFCAGGRNVAGKQLLVIVVDATWFFAKKMLRLSPNLLELPKISFRAGYRSQFKFKQQPAEECLSTIESCYYLMKELQKEKVFGVNLDADCESLMDVFKRMVDYQLESEKERLASGIPCRYARGDNPNVKIKNNSTLEKKN